MGERDMMDRSDGTRRRASAWWTRGAAAALIGAVGAGGASASGCQSSCERSQTCAPDGAGSAGGGGSAPVSCVPSEVDRIDGDSCGVFVSSSLGDDANPGTQQAPVRTITRAITMAQLGTGRVYVCAEEFEEAVVVPGGVTIHGGMTCQSAGEYGWGWLGVGFGGILTAPLGVVPLTLRGGEGVARIEDMEIVAQGVFDPHDESTWGKSSIAMVVDGIEAEIARCWFEAGDGATGVFGGFADEATGGSAGNPGNDACSGNVVAPGGDAVNDCGTPEDTSDDSIGGAGGPGQVSSGGDGSPGEPLGASNGGVGEISFMCSAGTAGADGAPGAPGAGATGLGSISGDGVTGVTGGEGTRGAPAQGGGGGGGAKGGNGSGKCAMIASAGGASGGSGGSGGCGGKGGKGGGPGGSSIGIVSAGATLTLDTVRIKVGSGGEGGVAGHGQHGGSGGDGGPGGSRGAASALHDGCAGGKGGKGGDGGPGGGGLGGHAIGIAFRGAPLPPLDSVTIKLEGEAGPGGHGQDGLVSGAPGVKAEVQEFP